MDGVAGIYRRKIEIERRKLRKSKLCIVDRRVRRLAVGAVRDACVDKENAAVGRVVGKVLAQICGKGGLVFKILRRLEIGRVRFALHPADGADARIIAVR